MENRVRNVILALGALLAVLLALFLVRPVDPGESVPPYEPPVITRVERVSLPAEPPSPARSAPVSPRSVPPVTPRPEQSLPEAPVRPDRALVRGTVRGANATATPARVVGCGASSLVDADGSFRVEIRTGPCELAALRHDGVFRMRGNPVMIDAKAGEELNITLDVPEHPAAGVGANIQEHELGIKVSRVMPGSPSQAAGLRPGDVVLAVDGAATVDLTLNDFIDRSLGREGTEVEYTVLRGDREIELTMQRAMIERGDP